MPVVYRLVVRCATPEARCRLCREVCIDGAILRPLGHAGEPVRPPASICDACIAVIRDAGERGHVIGAHENAPRA